MPVPPRPRPSPGGSGFTPSRLAQLLHEDPAFRLTTIDGLHWICPFTGTLVPAPFGWEKPALEWLTRERPWTRVAQRPVVEVAALRWEHWLKDRLLAPEAGWLRQFLPDGRWLNPFSGELVEGVPHDHGRLGRDSLRVLAQKLRDCPQAQGGQPLPREVLDARLRALRPPEPPAPAPERSSARLAAAPAQPRMPQGFRIIERLGKGGMGTVYRALQLALQREVALKVLDEGLAADGVYAERFLREARAAARVNHPNVIACYDVGRHGDRFYMALELGTGGDAEALARIHGGVLPERLALTMARDCARGLQAIASAGLVHRDIKPANIFLAADGSAKLGDLGLVRVQSEGHTTLTDTAVGTPAFMSPEQAQGEREVDIRSDIYALGATLYALLAGGPPFVNSNVFNILQQVAHRPPPDVRLANPGLAASTASVIARAMAKDRGARFQTPADLLAALEACLATGSAPAPATAPADPGLSWTTTVHGDDAGQREVAGEAWCIAGAGARPAKWLERALGATFAAASAEAVLACVPDDSPVAVARVAADGRVDLAVRGEALVAVLPAQGDSIVRLARSGERLQPGDALATVAGAGCRAALGLLLADGGNGGWPAVLLRVAAPTTAPAR